MAVTPFPLRRHPAAPVQAVARARVELSPWAAALTVLPLAADLVGRLAWPDVAAPVTVGATALAILGLVSRWRQGAPAVGYWFAMLAFIASAPYLLLARDLGSVLLLTGVMALGTQGAFSGDGSAGLMDSPDQAAPLPLPAVAARRREGRSTSPVPRAA